MKLRDWPTFSEAPTCRKCASAEISVVWRRAGESSYSDRLNIFDTEQGDYLMRYCQRCRFGWPEEPLDRTES